MNYDKRLWLSIFWVVLGGTLVGCNMAGLIEEFWSSMGISLMIIGAIQVVRHIRYRTDTEYREKMDIESSDERNRYLASKAWAWAGYLFVIVVSCGTIVFKLAGREDLMMMACGSVCLITSLYWISYVFLKRKY